MKNNIKKLFLLLALTLVACKSNDKKVDVKVKNKNIESKQIVEKSKDKEKKEEKPIEENKKEELNKVPNKEADEKDSKEAKSEEENKEFAKEDSYEEVLDMLEDEEFRSTQAPSTPHSNLVFGINGEFEGKGATISSDPSEFHEDYEEEYQFENHKSNFNGKFKIDEKIDDYSYKISLEDFEVTSQDAKLGDHTYEVNYAIHIDPSDEFILFTKQTPEERLINESEKLDRIYQLQFSEYVTYLGTGDKSLGYIIYNKTQDQVFHQWGF